MSYWGFDGEAHTGEMVVNAAVADDVLTIFRKLFERRFPIRRMELVNEFAGDDDRSMVADNTSAFNCRAATGHPGVWSEHSYGWAIDINPVENPYVSGSFVAPPSGREHLDRAEVTPGLVHDGDMVVRVFASLGWGWGGAWDSIKDFQHFSLTGR
jgi:hypothetical protein